MSIFLLDGLVLMHAFELLLLIKMFVFLLSWILFHFPLNQIWYCWVYDHFKTILSECLRIGNGFLNDQHVKIGQFFLIAVVFIEILMLALKSVL